MTSLEVINFVTDSASLQLSFKYSGASLYNRPLLIQNKSNYHCVVLLPGQPIEETERRHCLVNASMTWALNIDIEACQV